MTMKSEERASESERAEEEGADVRGHLVTERDKLRDEVLPS